MSGATSSPAPAGDPPLPGVVNTDADLGRALADAVAAKGAGYTPRARHRDASGAPRYTNRLIRESSPYLEQHAHNPVNWFPWGEEAFARARAESRLVLLSVGYSTCHWCHVMEHESFEDEEIAAAVNRLVVPVKVDREERPDVDAVYMTTVQLMAGHGGWPMTLFLTPDGEPVFGGTYIPPRDGARGARVGFLTVVRELARRYAEDAAGIGAQARRFAGHLRSQMAPRPGGAVPGAEAIRDAAAQLAEGFDPEYGGFGGAPKFPRPAILALLARYWRRTDDEAARAMVTRTLERMAQGGIRDHVGGGFHRYSVDDEWLVPHFEKMLYDNAQLAVAYVEGWQMTGRGDFADVAREILAYLEREMASPEGAFYSATDADSAAEGGHLVEGRFFTWTPAEIEAVLGPARARLFSAHYGVTPHGNFEGRTVLNAAKPLVATAVASGLDPERLGAELAAARAALYDVRRQRPPPGTDDKVLTSWNALAVSAFARAGFALDEPRLVAVAERAARFLLGPLRPGGRLHRVFKDGRARHEGYLDDYAFLVAALLDLYEVTGEVTWIEEALALQAVLDLEFWDEAAGGYFFSGSRHETLLARDKPDYDGAEPAGNSVAAVSLLRLAALTTETGYRERAERVLAAFGRDLTRRGLALPYMLAALDLLLDRPLAVVVVAPASGAGLAPLLAPLRHRFAPNRVLCMGREDAALDRHARILPLLAGRHADGGEAVAYVCRAETCELPTRDPAALARALLDVAPLGDFPPLPPVPNSPAAAGAGGASSPRG